MFYVLIHFQSKKRQRSLNSSQDDDESLIRPPLTRRRRAIQSDADVIMLDSPEKPTADDSQHLQLRDVVADSDEESVTGGQADRDVKEADAREKSDVTLTQNSASQPEMKQAREKRTLSFRGVLRGLEPPTSSTPNSASPVTSSDRSRQNISGSSFSLLLETSDTRTPEARAQSRSPLEDVLRSRAVVLVEDTQQFSPPETNARDVTPPKDSQESVVDTPTKDSTPKRGRPRKGAKPQSQVEAVEARSSKTSKSATQSPLRRSRRSLKSQSQPEPATRTSTEKKEAKTKKYKPGPAFTKLKGALPHREDENSEDAAKSKSTVDPVLSAAFAHSTLTSQDAAPDVRTASQSQSSTQSSVTSAASQDKAEVTKAKAKRRSVAGPLAGVRNMAALTRAMSGSTQQVRHLDT